ncbi:uncharacterized protein LOC106169300 [Lingula anatina]|uniref:Uncharacterized protein LOC106169300 n=1 Tax=Lingula anatina TaxID=7574 RepID=A0A1S3J2U2_LINAN|nr:uncharacterized protein LOC106169300 [Lingula anatina]|eukprot:XP_013404174.1 uncharacterized protein LOC106169300 [Lingula anatina]
MGRKKVVRKRMSEESKIILKESASGGWRNPTCHEGESSRMQGASARKILKDDLSSSSDSEGEEMVPAGYRLWNCGQLQDSIAKTCACRACGGAVVLVEDKEKRRGWASVMRWACTACGGVPEEGWTSTSRKTGKFFEINRASVLGMRAIGRGNTAAEKLSAYLSMPAPVAHNSWRLHSQALGDHARETAQESMNSAALRVKQVLRGSDVDPGEIVDCGVTIDGSWQTRNLSKHGFVAAISVDTGEILDVHYMCTTCRTCDNFQKLPHTTAEEVEFQLKHFEECPRNHEGSAQAMEAEGASVLYSRSMELYGLRYNPFVGDGDSSAFRRVQQEQPYGPDIEIRKEECIGHIQKRMGTRLRRLVARNKGVKLSDGKGLQGAGRLTMTRIDSMQTFYGLAIRRNIGNLDGMVRETQAITRHYSELADHSYCPEGESSWCKFQQDKACGTTTHREVEKPLPPAVIEVVQPIINELADPVLLAGCLRGLTQNQNESFHSTVWTMVPKDSYQSSNAVTLGLYMAVMYFNDGLCSSNEKLFHSAGIEFNKLTKNCFVKLDRIRISTCSKREDTADKENRRGRKRQKLQQLDAFRKVEGDTYKSGEFSQSSRNAPKCTTCKKPRKGHKKGLCT